MIYLLLAILSSSLLAFILPFSARYTKNAYSIYLFNYIVCFILSFAFAENKNVFSGGTTPILLGAIAGILYLASLALYRYNVLKNGLVLGAVFGRLGILVPVILSIFIFKEIPTVFQIIGIILAVVAIVIMNYTKEKGEFKAKALIELVVLLLVSGICDSMSKIFESVGERSSDDYYLFFIFIFATLATLIFLVKNKEKIGKYDILFGALVGIPNYFSSRFLLMSLSNLPAVIVYPAFSVGAVIIVSILSRVVFKNKLSKKQIVGIVIILSSLILLNF